MSGQRNSLSDNANPSKSQARNLAKVLLAKGRDELRSVADNNPALMREWIAELASSLDETQRDAELFASILDTLKASEKSRIHGVETDAGQADEPRQLRRA
jgi:hypothetical protein